MIVKPIEKDSAITGSDLQYLTLFYNSANYYGALYKLLYLNKFFIAISKIYNN